MEKTHTHLYMPCVYRGKTIVFGIVFEDGSTTATCSLLRALFEICPAHY